jgi:lipoprotein-releasing system permease protein
VSAAARREGPSALPPLPAPWLPFDWLVALRFLREGTAQSLFIVTGVAIGVAVIVFMSALLTGLQANFVNRVLTGQPHVQLLPLKDAVRPLRSGDPATRDVVLQAAPQRVKGIDQWQAVVAHVKNSAQVIVVAPVVNGAALAVRGDVSRAISVSGVEPDSYFRVVPIPDKLVRGSGRLTTGDILIGTELALDLGLAVGDRLRIATAAGAGLTLTITGIFDLGSKPANARTTFIALRSAQSLLGLPGGVSSIDLTLRDVYQAERFAQEVADAAGVQADSWIRTNEQFFSAVKTQTGANMAIRFFVGLSVAFGIASVLVVSVVQRSREIGILRAMGISRAQVMRIFLLQGGLLGLAGSLLGVVLGGAALLAFHTLQRNPDGTPLFPIIVEPLLFIVSVLLATLTGLAAALAPALRAARLDPVAAIRG